MAGYSHWEDHHCVKLSFSVLYMCFNVCDDRNESCRTLLGSDRLKQVKMLPSSQGIIGNSRHNFVFIAWLELLKNIKIAGPLFLNFSNRQQWFIFANNIPISFVASFVIDCPIDPFSFTISGTLKRKNYSTCRNLITQFVERVAVSQKLSARTFLHPHFFAEKNAKSILGRCPQIERVW